MNNYFSRRAELSEHARIHTSQMSKYNDKINETINKSIVYSEDSLIVPKVSDGNYKFRILDLDSVNGACYASTHSDGKVCILNFASYKNPGGKFLEGSSAQEESLCHSSSLFNVLSAFDSTYYEWNRKNLNRALYLNRAIYSPNVIFDIFNNDNYLRYFDVLTCAAPNLGPGLKYGKVTIEENSAVLRSRIKFVLDIMSENEVACPILGAFGCGVFKQNPVEVASIFKELIGNYDFNRVYFAIPGGPNLQAFNNVFGGWEN